MKKKLTFAEREALAAAGGYRYRGGLGSTTLEKPVHIYFIQVGEDGPIKIGMTRGNPLVRLASLQAGIPYELKLKAVIPDVQASVEMELHRCFRHLRIRREWFRPEHDLIAFIDTYALPWGAEAKEKIETRKALEWVRQMNPEQLQGDPLYIKMRPYSYWTPE